MIAKHTPEPWEYEQMTCDCYLIYSSDGGGLGRTFEPGENGARVTTPEENCANAARIVVCVNALAGVDDPAALVKRYEAAIEALRAMLDQYGDECEFAADRIAIEKARAVLAEHEEAKK